MLEALTHSIKRASSRRYTIRSSIVPPSGVHINVYCARPTSSRAAELVIARSSNSSASAPATSNSPMWPRSKIPAHERTARCSSIIPA